MALVLTQVYLEAKQKKALAAKAKSHKAFMAKISELRASGDRRAFCSGARTSQRPSARKYRSGEFACRPTWASQQSLPL